MDKRLRFLGSPELDGIVSAILNEMNRLESRVISSVSQHIRQHASTEPSEPEKSEDMPTLQGALHRICNRMEGVNQVLEMIINGKCRSGS